MKDIQNLLTQVSIIAKKNTEILQASGGLFNMFSLLGVDHYENTHSAIIWEFLNPKGAHGLKEMFLKEFIDYQISKHQTEFEKFSSIFDYKNAKAFKEYPTHDGRIDILIEDSKGHAIIIENKIHAVDQWNQLKRYDEFALHKYLEKENYQIFYLSLDGKEATENSGGGINYIQISHSDFIINWLERCVSVASRYPLVRETIIQYINHLKKLTNQDMSNINTREIVDLITSRQENIDAAIVIYKNYNALCKVIIEEIVTQELKPQMEKFAIQNGLILHRIHGSENTINIEFEKSSWIKCKMLINTEGANLYGFKYKDVKNKIELTMVDEIKRRLNKANTSDLWPIWKRTDNHKYINLDVWRNEIRSGVFGDYVIKLFSELLKITEGFEL